MTISKLRRTCAKHITSAPNIRTSPVPGRSGPGSIKRSTEHGSSPKPAAMEQQVTDTNWPQPKPRRLDTMNTMETTKRAVQRRRLLLNTAGAALAAPLVMRGTAYAQPAKGKATSLPAVKVGTNTSFASLKQIDAGVLNVGYAEAGPSNGPVAILLHGWPYDIYSFADVAPLLASAGYRVIVPYLRGYGSTQFLSKETVRNGEQAAVAGDIVALMDALTLEKATFAG